MAPGLVEQPEGSHWLHPLGVIKSGQVGIKKHKQVKPIRDAMELKAQEVNLRSKKALKSSKSLGRGGGLVVSVLAFYSYDPSSNPADY